MSTEEFSNEFDIHYDNIANKNSPGLDLYEKSVFLTKAQLEIIKNHFNPNGNKYKKGFESSEKRRTDLKELIKNYKTNTKISGDNKNLFSNSYFFNIPEKEFLIIQESITLSDDNSCINGKKIKVIPKRHDEVNIQINNPFKNPNELLGWRTDYSRIDNKKVVEIISKFDISEYHCRYIEYPKPIILTNLDSDEFIGLSIDGEKNKSTCMLDESIHREILDRAVEIAVIDYKQTGLQNKVQANLRNE